MCLVLFVSALDSVDSDSMWQMAAADVMPPPKFLRLIKAHYALTKVKVLATGGDSMTFEIRSGVRQKCALSLSTLFNYITD